MSIYALKTGGAVGIKLAFCDASLVRTADIGDTDIVGVSRLAIAVFAATAMAEAVDAELAGAALAIADAALHLGGFAHAVRFNAGAPRAATGVVGAGFLAQTVHALSAGSAFAVKDAGIDRQRHRLADGIDAFIAKPAVGLHFAAFRRRRNAGSRLARVALRIANIARSTIALAIAKTGFGAYFIVTAITAGRALI